MKKTCLKIFAILLAVSASATVIAIASSRNKSDSFYEENIEALADNEYGIDYKNAKNVYCNNGNIGCKFALGRTCTVGVFCN